MPRAWDEATASTGFKMNDLCRSGSSWAYAVELNGYSRRGALALGLLRALLWHAVQPTAYFLTFSAYMDELDDMQRFFGWGVAVREAIYLLTVLACLYINPAFLLVDVRASVSDTGGRIREDALFRGSLFLDLYVLAPEKFVAFAAFGEGGLDHWVLALAVLGGALLDLCGLAALGAGLGAGQGKLPPALAVGYCVTALAAGCLECSTRGRRH